VCACAGRCPWKGIYPMYGFVWNMHIYISSVFASLDCCAFAKMRILFRICHSLAQTKVTLSDTSRADLSLMSTLSTVVLIPLHALIMSCVRIIRPNSNFHLRKKNQGKITLKLCPHYFEALLRVQEFWRCIMCFLRSECGISS
jgi:hypothetical protein